jgi:PAS domain S-box-containing protein
MEDEIKTKEALAKELIDLRRRNDELETAINKLREVEKKLGESEERYRGLFERIPVGLYRTTPEGQVLNVNKALAQLLGYPDQESLLAINVSVSYANPQDHVRWQSLVARESVVRDFEVQWRRYDGTIIWVRENVRAVRDGEGRVLHYEGAVEDITERKHAEEQLRESEESYRVLFEGSTHGILGTDIETHRLLFSNPAICRMFGYSKEEFQRLSITKLHPKDTIDIVISEFESQLRGEKPISFALPCVRKDGTVFYADIAGASTIFKGRKCVVGFFSDVTKRKQAEAELIIAKEHAEESDRLKSAFLANMSHEIRTPMNGILGFAELLKEPNLTGEEQQKFIRFIEESGARMLNIIHNIVDISKIESEQMEVSLKETNVNEQIQFIYNFFKPEVERKGMQLLVKNALPSKESIIKTDPEHLYSILTNIVKNAIKYTQTGSIEFGYEKKGKYLEFFVKDTGEGIRQEQKEIIFERFRQGDDLISRFNEGAGLGLSISKAYVEMLGGKIWVESELGKGSIFYFTIPYNAETEAKTVVKNIVSVDGTMNRIKNLKILIVEDDETSENLIKTILKRFAKEFLLAGTGVEAVEACRNNPDIDLVLMDIKLPEMNGYEATRQIRQFNKDVAIIAQTAYGLSGDREKAIEAGCNDYISKPIDINLLKMLIKKHFNK